MLRGKQLNLYVRRSGSPRQLAGPFVLGVWLFLCFGGLSTSVAQEVGSFIWKRDATTEKELAASRSESSFNFFDVGDLSYYSQYLVEQDLRRLSVAAGLTIDHTPAKNSSILVVHDTKVFSRLKNDKAAFKSLGFSDRLMADLEKQITSDSPKCLAATITDGKNNVTVTVVLLSEKFDRCLVGGLLSSFGIAMSDTSDIGIETLIDVCVLYEGRRHGLRDRESLTREASRLRNVCLAKAETSNDKPVPVPSVNAAGGQ